MPTDTATPAAGPNLADEGFNPAALLTVGLLLLACGTIGVRRSRVTPRQ